MNQSTSNITGGLPGDFTPCANLDISIRGGGGCICVKLVIIRVFFQTPVIFTCLRTCRDSTVRPIFVVFVDQRTCFGVIYVVFGM